ncbi:hypothetical protein Tco_0930953 [Tanacetum coccineum]
MGLNDPVLEDIENKDFYVSNLDEPILLVTPLSDANEDECFDLGGDIDKINAFLDMDVSTDVEDGYYDSEGDIIYLESLLIKYTTHNLPLEMFLDLDPRSLKDEHDKDDLIFLPYLTYSMDSSFLLSSGSEDTIDLGISASSFYFLESVAYESPMMIFPFFYFCPKDKGIRGEIGPDYEDSRARGFVHRSLDLQSLACFYMGIRYPRSY